RRALARERLERDGRGRGGAHGVRPVLVHHRDDLAALAVAQDQYAARPARRARRIAAPAGPLDRADAKARDFVGRAARAPRLPAVLRLDGEIFRNRPRHASGAVVAERALGDRHRFAEIDEFFYVGVREIKDAALHTNRSRAARAAPS